MGPLDSPLVPSVEGGMADSAEGGRMDKIQSSLNTSNAQIFVF